MNQSLLTRLKRVENSLLTSDVPNLIWIAYDDTNKLYRVEADYYYTDRENRRKTLYLEHYKDYVFKSNYQGRVFMDLINAKENGAFLFKCSDVRKQAGVSRDTAFSLDYDEGESDVIKIESVFKLMERIDI